MESKLSPRAFLVLVVLAVRGSEVMTREELAFTLWPDLSETEARATLRRQLYNVDRALAISGESVLSRNSKVVSWAENLDVFVDVLEFTRLCERRDALEEAAGLYAGDFAPHLDHEWTVALRDRLRQRMCHVLDQLIVQCRMRDDERRSQDFVERLLSVDPWREDAVRELMMQRYRCGDRAGALRCYRSFAQSLRSEFDVEPMPETVRCFEIISTGSRLQLAEGIAQ
ncbi:MAG: BTAD domain-containing putative transcriptional regulator [Candidatus Aquilonibacter sp.]